ncbi:ACT domain-containing protein [Halochromatium salexigens]|uniref:Amino acid-binding protein n=1 Tax=Halochromatium salexigens TaxID=49447 RepID=A0AAJ0XEP4_HALSE|nr:ACT domain-containing protein [Halochromatium salexigens]MBK5930074.1 amino acid-binding protein [Halochromatium salexigens]
MKLTQLSVFLENRPGRLIEPTRLLAAEGVKIMTLCLADTAEFGILRLIVQDPAHAAEVLDAAGWSVTLTEVVAVEVHDQPGGLAEVLGVFEQAGLNVEYVYAFTLRREDRAILVFRFQQPDQAIAALHARGHQVLDAERLEALVG